MRLCALQRLERSVAVLRSVRTKPVTFPVVGSRVVTRVVVVTVTSVVARTSPTAPLARGDSALAPVAVDAAGERAREAALDGADDAAGHFLL